MRIHHNLSTTNTPTTSAEKRDAAIASIRELEDLAYFIHSQRQILAYRRRARGPLTIDRASGLVETNLTLVAA